MFPVTLDVLKRNLRMSTDRHDKDELLALKIEQARSILAAYLGQDRVDSPPSILVGVVLASGTMLASSLFRDRDPFVHTAWKQIIEPHRRWDDNMTDDDLYSSLKSILKSGPDMHFEFDDAAETVTVSRLANVNYERKIGWSATRTVQPADVIASPHTFRGSAILIPTQTGSAHLWVWLGFPAIQPDEFEVGGTDLLSSFGAGLATTVGDVTGALFVSINELDGDIFGGKPLRVG